jgi:hypothetical protein
MSRNALSYSAMVALTRWIDEHWEEIQATRPSYEEAASQASTLVNGQTYTRHNVKTAAEAINKQWTPAGRKSRTSSKRTSAMLADAILRIADALGIVLDPNIKKIARRSRVTAD